MRYGLAITWSTPRAIEGVSDRGFYTAPAISPNGTDVYVVYNAFTTPYQPTTATPRRLVGVVLHADSATNPGTATGSFSETLGANVSWDDRTNTARISSGDASRRIARNDDPNSNRRPYRRQPRDEPPPVRRRRCRAEPALGFLVRDHVHVDLSGSLDDRLADALLEDARPPGAAGGADHQLGGVVLTGEIQ